MSVFHGFPDRLQYAIANTLGFTSLRPVQELAGEAIEAGKNAVVLAPTAGGKTEASMFPVIAGLMREPPSGVGAIYVAPIKALLNNQEVRLGQYTQMVGLDRFVWHGDAKQSHKAKFVREPCELLMTTPESLEVMLMSPRVPVKKLFKDLRYVVIDEVHAFAGSDRGAHLMSVLERLRIRADVPSLGEFWTASITLASIQDKQDHQGQGTHHCQNSEHSRHRGIPTGWVSVGSGGGRKRKASGLSSSDFQPS